MVYYNYPSSSPYPYFSSSTGSSSKSSFSPPAAAARSRGSGGPWTLQTASSHAGPRLHKILIGVAVGVVVIAIVLAAVFASRGESSSSSNSGGTTSGTGGSGSSGCSDAADDSEGASEGEGGGGGGGGLSGGVIAAIVISVLTAVGVLAGSLFRYIRVNQAKRKAEEVSKQVFDEQSANIEQDSRTVIKDLTNGVMASLANKGMQASVADEYTRGKIEVAIDRIVTDFELDNVNRETLGETIISRLHEQNSERAIDPKVIQATADFIGAHLGAKKVPKYSIEDIKTNTEEMWDKLDSDHRSRRSSSGFSDVFGLSAKPDEDRES